MRVAVSVCVWMYCSRPAAGVLFPRVQACAVCEGGLPGPHSSLHCSYSPRHLPHSPHTPTHFPHSSSLPHPPKLVPTFTQSSIATPISTHTTPLYKEMGHRTSAVTTGTQPAYTVSRSYNGGGKRSCSLEDIELSFANWKGTQWRLQHIVLLFEKYSADVQGVNNCEAKYC